MYVVDVRDSAGLDVMADYFADVARIIRENGAHSVRVGLDEEGVKLSVNYSTWSPPSIPGALAT